MKVNNKNILKNNLSTNSTVINIKTQLEADIQNYANSGKVKQKVKYITNQPFSIYKILKNFKKIFKINFTKKNLNPKQVLNSTIPLNLKIINQIHVKKNFKKFFTKNNLYQTFNLRQDFPYPNFLQLKSEIQRSAVFRDLVNKEEGYYQAIKKSPLIILISPKPKNIYVTVYTVAESNTGYNILWKKSTGMLQKVEGQLSLPALIEIFTKLNIFLSKEYLAMQSPVRLIIKSAKYYGTTTIIQNFVKLFEKNIKLNYIFFMYKYRKRFNFFSNYAKLINDSLFNYLSSIWLKFLKIIKKTKMIPKYIFSIPQLIAYNKFFGIEFNLARRRYKINHFARVKRIKSLQTKQLKFKKPQVKHLKKRKAIIKK